MQGLIPSAFDRLEEINVPTLIIIGELDDPYYIQPIADVLKQRVPNAIKVVMPDVGHMANIEDPSSFNEIVVSFLDNLGQ